jgi:cell wall-associated NlpC family hydrolase
VHIHSPTSGAVIHRFTAPAAVTYIETMKRLLFLGIPLLLAACASPPLRQYTATDDQMNELVMYAVSLADTPYRYGGKSSNSGFDCSGFVGHVYRHSLDISLPRTSREISRVGLPISINELSPGDLVFYNTQHASFSHVGIYVGDGKFVHSPRSGEMVRTEQMALRYWQARYDGARRLRR